MKAIEAETRTKTRSQFIAYCKNLMKKNGFGQWIDPFDGLVEEALDIRQGKKEQYTSCNYWKNPNELSAKEIWEQPFDELNTNDGQGFQMYYKSDDGSNSYNITFEYDEQFRIGYFYLFE